MSWLAEVRGLGLLVEALIKSTALLSVGLLLAGLFRKKSAALRHFILAVSVIALLVLPVLSLLPWGWGIRLLPAGFPSSRPAFNHPQSNRLISDLRTATQMPGAVLKVDPTKTPRALTDGSSSDIAAGDGSPLLSPGQFSAPRLAGTAVGGLWIIGMAFMLARLAVGLAGASRLSREGAPLDNPSWQSILRRFLAAASLKRQVRLKSHPNVAIPLTWGIMRPVVLMPADADVWSDEERSSALFHELSHIKRVDFLVMMLVRVSLALYWFNPLSRLAVRRLKKEQEKACDELVLRTGIKPSIYAATLLALTRSSAVRWSPSLALLGLLGMPAGSPLNERLETILGNNHRFKEIRMKTKLALSMVIILAVALIGMARPAAIAANPQSDRVITVVPADQIAGQESTGVEKQVTPKTAPKPEKSRRTKPLPPTAPAPAAQPAEVSQPAPLVPPVDAVTSAPPQIESTANVAPAATQPSPTPRPDSAAVAVQAPQPAPSAGPVPRAAAPAAQPVLSLQALPVAPSVLSAKPTPAAPQSVRTPETTIPLQPEASPEPPVPAPESESGQEAAKNLRFEKVVIKFNSVEDGRGEIVITDGDRKWSLHPDHDIVFEPNSSGKIVTVKPQGWKLKIGEGKDVRVVVKGGTISFADQSRGVKVDEASHLTLRTDESGTDVIVRYEVPGFVIEEEGAPEGNIEFRLSADKDAERQLEIERESRGGADATRKIIDGRLQQELEVTRKRLQELEDHKFGLEQTLKEAAETLARVQNEAVRAKIAELNGRLSKEVEASIRESETALRQTLEQTERILKEVSENTMTAVKWAEQSQELGKAMGDRQTKSWTVVPDEGTRETRPKFKVRKDKTDKMVGINTIEGGFKLTFNGFWDAAKTENYQRAVEKMKKELPEGATLESSIDEEDRTITIRVHGVDLDENKTNLTARLTKILKDEMK